MLSLTESGASPNNNLLMRRLAYTSLVRLSWSRPQIQQWNLFMVLSQNQNFQGISQCESFLFALQRLN